MSVQLFINAVIRKWWLVIILVILGAGAGALKVYTAPPVYKATVTLYMMNIDKVMNKREELNATDIQLSRELLAQFADVIHSRTVHLKVINDLKKYNLTEKKLSTMTVLDSNIDSNIFTITATSSDPRKSAEVANDMAETFSQTIKELSNANNVGILDRAIVPQKQESRNALAIILLGAVAGFVLATCTIYLIEYFDTTVHSEKDIVEGINAEVVGIIPKYNIR